jgi:hypothetical protein
MSNNLKIIIISCEIVERFKHLGIYLTNQNSINKNLKTGSSHGLFATNQYSIFFSSLLSKNLKFKLYRTKILRVVLMGGKLARSGEV